MDISENLTNEKIGEKFENQFKLVNYAIKMAENMIKTGREPRVKAQTENPALLVLEEISEGKDKFEEISIEKVPVSKEIITEMVETTEEIVEAVAE